MSKQTQLKSLQSDTQRPSYANSTKQMQDLNTLTYRKSTEINTTIHKTHKYSFTYFPNVQSAKRSSLSRIARREEEHVPIQNVLLTETIRVTVLHRFSPSQAGSGGARLSRIFLESRHTHISTHTRIRRARKLLKAVAGTSISLHLQKKGV